MSEGEQAPDTISTISASLGDLDLTVEGADDDWVVEQFEEQWSKRLEEASEMKHALSDGDPRMH